MNRYKEQIEKQAATKWKEKYHELSNKNRNKLIKTVGKSNSEIAKGVELGNKNLIEKWDMNDIVDDKEFQQINSKGGKTNIVSPKSLADFDIKNSNMSKSEKAMLNVFDKFSGVKKLSKGDKELYNAVSKRNAIVKGTHGFDAQMMNEGAFSPYYENKSFPKKLKLSRSLLDPKNDGLKNYGKKISVNKDMSNQFKKDLEISRMDYVQKKPFQAYLARDNDKIIIDHCYKNKEKYKDKIRNIPKSRINKKLALGIGIGTAGIGLGAYGLSKFRRHSDEKR